MVDSTEFGFEFNGFNFDTFVDCLKYLNKLVQFSLEAKLNLDISQLPFTDAQ